MSGPGNRWDRAEAASADWANAQAAYMGQKQMQDVARDALMNQMLGDMAGNFREDFVNQREHQWALQNQFMNALSGFLGGFGGLGGFGFGMGGGAGMPGWLMAPELGMIQRGSQQAQQQAANQLRAMGGSPEAIAAAQNQARAQHNALASQAIGDASRFAQTQATQRAGMVLPHFLGMASNVLGKAMPDMSVNVGAAGLLG